MSLSELRPAPKDEWQFHTLLIWAVALCVMLYLWKQQIFTFTLIDTDDNLRIVQVRDWLAGQGWYDLQQHRLAGSDIHWSRIVDIPMALIILILRPFFGQETAETVAMAMGPVLPLSLAMLGLGAACRALIGRWSYLLAFALLFCAIVAMRMFAPMRIDHHGWQLAMLSLMLAGLSLDNRIKGGALAGGAAAFSLSIGLEMLPFLALGGATLGLRWIWDRAEAARLGAYGATLGACTALGFLLFASNANWLARCDALSPVWLSVMVLAGALLLLISFIPADSRLVRLGLAALAGIAVIALMVLAWPQCLSKPEGISDEAYTYWFQNIREVKPLIQQSPSAFWATIGLPLSGLLGAFAMTARNWRQGLSSPWFGMLLLSAASLAMLWWQTRIGASAQILAIPGASALCWTLFERCRQAKSLLVRVLPPALVFLAISGLMLPTLITRLKPEKPSAARKAGNNAFAKCTATPNWQPIGALPQATIFTFVDLAPRLLSTTHHKSITGPYHRNDDLIVDVHKAFSGTPEVAHQMVRKYKAGLLLICPNLGEASLNIRRAPNGFAAQLQAGRIPDWLEPVALPAGSPFRLWRVKG